MGLIPEHTHTIINHDQGTIEVVATHRGSMIIDDLDLPACDCGKPIDMTYTLTTGPQPLADHRTDPGPSRLRDE